MTLDEIDQALAKLRAAKLARLTGESVTKIQYSDGAAEYGMILSSDIDKEIRRLEWLRAEITGERRGYRPIRPGFGGRV